MLYLSGDITPDMQLWLAQRLDKKPNKINLMLNSSGGEILSAFAIYDRLAVIPKSTITATGECSSAAGIILQAAKIRRATPHTQFVFHLTSFRAFENCEQSQEDKLESQACKVRFDQVIFGILGYRMTNAAIQTALKRRVFGAEEALKFGMLDEIWEG